jgi:hypothetical protein
MLQRETVWSAPYLDDVEPLARAVLVEEERAAPQDSMRHAQRADLH